VVVVLLAIAAVVGDAVNYSIGRYLGPRVFSAEDRSGPLHKLLNREHLERAHAFFEHHGGKAIVIARFVPIIRTFVPFVAGAGAMRYSTFALYNIAGGLLWVGVCVGAGYAFGNVPVIKENFSLVVLGIIGVSLVPMLLEAVKHMKKGQRG
jgi:membrane-associated protein